MTGVTYSVPAASTDSWMKPAIGSGKVYHQFSQLMLLCFTHNTSQSVNNCFQRWVDTWGWEWTILFILIRPNSSVSARKASISVTEVSDIHPTPNNQKFLLTLSYTKSKNKFSPFSIWSADASNFFSRVVSPLQVYTKSEVMHLAFPASWCSFYRLRPTSLNPINKYFQPCCLLCVLPKCNDITVTAPSPPRWWESINSAPSAVHFSPCEKGTKTSSWLMVGFHSLVATALQMNYFRQELVAVIW